MQADTADLINGKDNTHKISATPSTTPVALNANQWGYALNNSATTFSAVPAAAQSGTTAAVQSGATAATPIATPAVIADVTKAKPAGCTNPANCTKQVTFAANIDPAKLASGSYSAAITYTATAKPKPAFTGWYQRTAKIDPSEVCRSGDNSSSCLVDLDKNMIPVKYTGTTTNAQWTSLANPEDNSNQGNWYNYNQKQWANAITVKPEALSKYQGQTKVVDQADILGFWVYIPRYRYKVLRYSTSDSPVPAQNFTIEFENKQSTKAIPTANGTWATHPAFTFGNKELNGIWFAKFETTGTNTQPTVLPNEAHISGRPDIMGVSYSVAKSLGVNDPQNVGGNSVSTTQNNHHLTKLSSHMVNNNDWGATTYLSASKYGAGYNGVQINASSAHHSDVRAAGATGCGPQANGNTSTYDAGGALGTQQACSEGNPQRAYNGTLGQLASTTNNPTGIYDMSGGGLEYVAANYSDNLNESGVSDDDDYVDGYGGFGPTAAHPPYVNIYNFRDLNSCTFATCGGQALYETNNGSGNDSYQWNGNDMRFVNSFGSWLQRGGIYHDGSNAGLFCAQNYIGAFTDGAFRVALAPAP